MKLALVICPQWSDITPSFALGSLMSHIDNPNVKVKQFDLNIGSSLYFLKKGDKKFRDLYDWENDKPWNERKNVINDVIPFFKDYWQEYIDELATYDVVAFSVYTSNIIITDYIARYIKQKNKNTQIWYGGPFSWYCDSGSLEEDGIYREFVDVACSENEGELIIKDLVDKYYEEGHYENVGGIWRWDKMTPSFPTVLPKGRSGRKPVFNGRVRAMVLDTLKPPTWDKKVMEDYFELCEYANIPKTLPIQSSRGCTFKCTFCQETRLYRFKNFEKIIVEMKEQSEKYGTNAFWFTDSLINGSMRKFTEFVRRLEEEDMHIGWSGFFRTHKKLDTELLKKAVKHGLLHMRVGTEAGVNKILALMEKNQTTEDVSHFLKSSYESKTGIYANWIPGYPKENFMDFLLTIKFLFDNSKYFLAENTTSVTRLNLMQATDVLDKTPLDIFRDDFEVAKDKEIFNCWISNDLTNTLVVRQLRGYLVNMFSRSLGMNVVDASFKTFTNVKNNMINVKPEYNDDFLVSDFLDFEEQSEVSEIIRRELIQVLKTFSWFVHNVADNYNYEFDYEDKFLGYNCDNSNFKLKFKLKSGKLSYGFRLRIGEKDNFFEQDISIDSEDTIILKGNKKSDKVKDFYLDSTDYEKHRVNYKRVPLTNQY